MQTDTKAVQASAINQVPDTGHGHGQLKPAVHVWAPVQDAAPDVEPGGQVAPNFGAVHVAKSIDRLPVGAALQGRAMPAGPLMEAIQGQKDLALAQRCARRLGQSMQRDGRHISEATEADGIGAGAAAVIAWRNGAELDGGEHGAAGVCWRAVVASMSADMLGESVSLADFSPEALAGSALPLPGTYESRHDTAARLVFERARAKRPALLARRIEAIKAQGGRGRRAELVDKVQRAAVLLLHGEALDNAAAAVGFKASGSGRHAARAGDRLAQAVRRLGFKFRFTARQRERRAVASRPKFGAGLPASIAAAWSFHPSASLPLQDGRGGKRWVGKLARLARRNRRKARRQAARARVGAIIASRERAFAKRTIKRTATARKVSRTIKRAGFRS